MSSISGSRRLIIQNPKKKVLSNKQLTRKVRKLSGMEGEREHFADHLYAAVLLTAGTADINYFKDTSPIALFESSVTRIQHYYDCHIKLLCSAAGGATVRLLYGFDEDWDGTNLVVAEILDTTSDSVSGLLTADVVNFKESKHKNRAENYRCVIVKDMIIALEQNVPKAFNVRLPLFNRKSRKSGGANITEFTPFMLALADENDVTFSMAVDYYSTNIQD